tara:strand:+ start:1748 stop:2473 length:726 start_codon:yes stop_codon:yes gene_type:complete
MSLTEIDIKRLKTQEKGLIYIRDALSFYLMDVRIRHNFYNISIIIISMLTAFFETLNTEFEWDVNCGGGIKKRIIIRFATIFPITMTTSIAFISTMMKFERLSDKMEDTTKSIEKCHYAINRQREIVDEGESCRLESLNAASTCFREALMNAEMLWLSRMDPVTKRKYLKRSNHVHGLFAKNEGTWSVVNTENMDQEIINLIEQSFKPHKPLNRWGIHKYTVFFSRKAKKENKITGLAIEP